MQLIYIILITYVIYSINEDIRLVGWLVCRLVGGR